MTSEASPTGGDFQGKTEARPRGNPNWKPGVSGNPGGRAKHTRADYEAVSFATVTLERWSRIVERAAQDAEKGVDKARTFVMKILGAEAASRIEAKVQASAELARLSTLPASEIIEEYQRVLAAKAPPEAPTQAP